MGKSIKHTFNIKLLMVFIILSLIAASYASYAQIGSNENDILNKETVRESESYEEVIYKNYYKAPLEVNKDFHILTKPFIKEQDVNDYIKDSMSWDKNIKFAESPEDKVHMSFGVVKLTKVLGGVMFRVPIFK